MSRHIEIQVEIEKYNKENEIKDSAADIPELQEVVKDIWPLNDILNDDTAIALSGTGNISMFEKTPVEIVKDIVGRIWKVIGEHPVTARVIYLEDPPFDEWSFNGREDLGDLDGDS